MGSQRHPHPEHLLSHLDSSRIQSQSTSSDPRQFFGSTCRSGQLDDSSCCLDTRRCSRMRSTLQYLHQAAASPHCMESLYSPHTAWYHPSAWYLAVDGRTLLAAYIHFHTAVRRCHKLCLRLTNVLDTDMCRDKMAAHWSRSRTSRRTDTCCGCKFWCSRFLSEYLLIKRTFDQTSRNDQLVRLTWSGVFSDIRTFAKKRNNHRLFTLTDGLAHDAFIFERLAGRWTNRLVSFWTGARTDAHSIVTVGAVLAKNIRTVIARTGVQSAYIHSRTTREQLQLAVVFIGTQIAATNFFRFLLIVNKTSEHAHTQCMHPPRIKAVLWFIHSSHCMRGGGDNAAQNVLELIGCCSGVLCSNGFGIDWASAGNRTENEFWCSEHPL